VIDKIVKKLIEKLDVEKSLTDVQKEQISYSLTAIINDLSKVTILFSVFSLLGLEMQFLAISVYSVLLRVIIGGHHFKSYWTCFVFTSMYYAVLMTAGRYSINGTILTTAYTVFAVILIWLAPSTSQERAAIRKHSATRYKIAVAILIVTYYTIHLLFEGPITQLGLITVIFQSIQLLSMKVQDLAGFQSVLESSGVLERNPITMK
jgi:accessory gene regulator B